MKNLILTIFILFSLGATELYAFETLDTGYQEIKRYSAEFRLGLTGTEYLLNQGDSKVDDVYKGFAGIFLDWNMLRWRSQKPGVTDIFTRISYRNYNAEVDSDSGIFWDGRMDLFSGGAGIRYNYSLKFLSKQLLLFASLHGEVLYLRESSSDRDTSRDYLSLGLVGGLGAELAPAPEYGFFIEYNYGYAPVGSDDSNIEGHQIWFGADYRTR